MSIHSSFFHGEVAERTRNVGRRQYTYEPIHQGQIRLLSGHVEEGQFIAELRPYNLDDPELPAFDAVSYTWGLPAYSNSVIIDGADFPVLDSLYPFLCFLAQSKPTNWWVDSISINQNDKEEKSHQIPLMRRIFRAAQQTQAYLGEEADDGELAVAFLRELGDRYGKKQSNEWISTTFVRGGMYKREWDAIGALFSRPWWTRVWTVQEYIIPLLLDLYCGTERISREGLTDALHCMWQGSITRLDHFDTPWNRTRIVEWYQTFGEDKHTLSLRSSLVATVAYLGLYKASNPRDRLYALSGLVRDSHLTGNPDYSQPVEHLYTRFVKAFVEHYKSLDIICYATVFRGSDTLPSLSLPSWVPDWTVPATAMVGPAMASQPNGPIGNLRPLHSLDSSAIYNASLGATPHVKFSDDLAEISCAGLLVDTIDALTAMSAIPRAERCEADGLVEGDFGHLQISSTERSLSYEEASDTMMSIMLCLVLDRGDRYFNHAAPTEEFCSQFKTYLGLALDFDRALKYSFKAWFRENRSLRIRGWSLEKLARAFVGVGFHASANQQLGQRGTFFSRMFDTVAYMSRRLVVTKHGIICMAPGRAHRGDLVCVLLGCSIPVVLRPIEHGKFSFIGECYVDGFMNGEVLSMRKREWKKQVFEIV